MKVRPLPKSWLIHSIEYYDHTGTDDFGSETYAEKVDIEFVRVDETAVFSRDGRENKITANGVIFVDAIHSAPKVDFKERSKVIFNNRELIIAKVVNAYQPESNEVHHWELEVL